MASIAICLIAMLSVTASAEGVMAFNDVSESDWYYHSVQYVYEVGLMNGTGDNTFSPNGTVTRGMIVTILWRREGAPVASGYSFTDVAADAYYTNAVSWAAEKGIVNGYGGNRFGPQDAITREQFAAILYRYSEKNGADVSARSDLSVYSDSNLISAYAYDALSWANASGLIKGVGGNKMNPAGTATRAQAATILERYNNLGTAAPASGTTLPTEEGKKDEPNPSIPPETDETSPPPVVVPEEDDTQKPKTDKLTISVETVEGRPGSDVNVTVSIQNNPGVLGAMLTLRYPESLKMNTATNGQAFSELTLTTPKALRSPGTYLWDGLDTAATGDGDILNLSFHVSDTLISGKTLPISIEYIAGDFFDASFNELKPVIVNGSIIVK